MNTFKGNQKHLTLSDRICIEKGLNDGKSFAEIGRETHKDPTTISKEVRKHTKVKEYTGYATVPCEANKDVHVKCGDQDVIGGASPAVSSDAVQCVLFTSHSSVLS